MSYFDFYLLTVVFKLHTLAFIFTSLLTSFTLFMWVVGLSGSGETKLDRGLKLLCLATGVSLALYVVTPSKDDGKLIIAAGTVAKVVENKDVQRITGKSLAAIEAWLENVEKKDSK